MLEIGRRIDAVLSGADRQQLVALLAVLKHREVLIVEALRPDGAAAPKGGMITIETVAGAFRVSTRTAYRLARREPLLAYAVWDGRRLRGFLPGVRSLLPVSCDESRG